MNRADSLDIEKQLASGGYVRARDGQAPDVWVLNTCAVTAEGMRKSRKALRRCASSGARVIVTGCAVDMDASEMSADGVAAIYTNREKGSIVRDLGEGGALGPRTVPWSPEDLVRVPVKVQDGCSRYCSYCIVPYLRPEPQSKTAEAIMEEVRAAVEAGAGEVILCGIDLGSYREPDHGWGITRLAESVSGESQDAWVRLSSIELFDVDDGLADLMRDGAVCGHLHVPLQSGDERVLTDMKRHYDPEEFARRVEELKDIGGGLAVTSDVMVGFPTEDETAFENTRIMVERMAFSRLHVFKYSRRPGTGAFDLGDPVEPGVKSRRARELRALGGELASRFHAGLVGRIIQVLVEGSMESEPGMLFGRARSFAGVVFSGGPGLIGKIVEVRVTSSNGGYARAESYPPARTAEGGRVGR